MLVFGVDVPLIEVVFGLTIVSFIILVEIVVVVILLMQNLKKAKELGSLLNRLSQVLLAVKKEEVKEIDRIKHKKG